MMTSTSLHAFNRPAECFKNNRIISSLFFSLSLSLLAFFLTFHLSPHSFPFHHVNRDKALQWPLPPSPRYLFYKKNSNAAKRIRSYSWTQPRILTSFARPFYKNDSITELAMFTTGVTMGTFGRNFSAFACLVGTDAFPVVRSETDVFYCHLPIRIKQGTHLSLLLDLDDTLQRAIDGPVLLNFGLNITLDRSRLVKVPGNTVFHVDSASNSSNYLLIQSEHRFQLNPRDFVTKSSDYQAKPRYESCVIAPIKHTSHLLPSWIDYHRRIGFDHVYVLDNDDPNDLEKMFSRRKDVDVLYWPWKKTQPQHLTFSLLWARNYCSTLHICDSDEYLLLGIGKNMQYAAQRPLSKWVRARKKEGINVFFFPYLMMNNSMNVRVPSKPPPEVYTHISTEKSNNGKAMLDLDFPWTKSVIHSASGWTRTYSYHKDFSFYPKELDDRPIQVHYRYRSFEEMERKKNVGSGSMMNNLGTTREWEEPDFSNPPAEYLTSDPKMKYTFFRDVWREVTRNASLSKVSIVRSYGEKRCVRTYDMQLRTMSLDAECE